MWAWANSSLDQALRIASEKTRAWGEQHRHVMLNTGRLEVSEEQARDLAALGFRLSGASGFYRAPTGRSDLYLVFGTVTLVSAEGEREDFSFDVG